MREKFLHADVGVTGANLIAADTGTLMLVESEGNIRLSSFAPPVHIAIAGIEKIIPTREEMAPFLELLSMSATGQPMSVYTSFISPPLADPPFAMPSKALKPREFHLVLIDNGRLKMRDDPVFHEALNCIRCGACLEFVREFSDCRRPRIWRRNVLRRHRRLLGSRHQQARKRALLRAMHWLHALCAELPRAHRYSVAQREPRAIA